jgi:hypothetical protein
MYSKPSMRFRAAFAILALASLATNFCPASLCAFHCLASTGNGPAHHHHQMNRIAREMISPRGRESVSHPATNRNQDSNCAECAAKLEDTFRPAAECSSLLQIDALKESSFSLDPPDGAAHFALAQLRAYGAASLRHGEPISFLAVSPMAGSFITAPISLRI